MTRYKFYLSYYWTYRGLYGHGAILVSTDYKPSEVEHFKSLEEAIRLEAALDENADVTIMTIYPISETEEEV